MRGRVPFIAVAAVVAVLAAGCTAPIAQRRDNQSQDGAIAWRDCADEVRAGAARVGTAAPDGVAFQCGTVTVPRDWNSARDGKAADGRSFDLAVIRARSDRQTERIGSLLVNPGGPGGSGFDYAIYLAGELSGPMEHFDLIGFDPRGVGQSAPVKCIADTDMDANFGYEPDPVSQATFNGVVALNRKIADACGAKYGEDLRLFSTEQAARDLDAIRAAVGDEKLTYLGYSYGTLLGAVYAGLFPQKIRAMVLDGAEDAQQGPVAATEGQARGFERAFANFVTWCKQQPVRTCPLAPDARAAVLKALDEARTSPVDHKDGRRATAGWVLYAVLTALYSQDFWSPLAQGIFLLERGDATMIFLLVDLLTQRDRSGHYSNFFDALNAIDCVDSDKYPSIEEVRALQAEWRKKYPLFGAPLAIGMLSCAVWPAKHDPYPIGPATGSPPIVVVGTTGDPATPYESTAKLAKLLGTGTTVTWQGEGHTAYPQTTCVRKAVDDYLIDLKVPARDLTCPAR